MAMLDDNVLAAIGATPGLEVEGAKKAMGGRRRR